MIKGNNNYAHYTDSILFTAKYNLMELYYQFLREDNILDAERYLAKYSANILEIDTETIRESMKFKFKNKNEKLSYCDCIGWAKAKELGIPFLTGDAKFKEKENVTFVV
jgi:predicted nucleic acid-binding protein